MLSYLIPIAIVIGVILLILIGYAFWVGKKILDVILNFPSLFIGLLSYIISLPRKLLEWMGILTPSASSAANKTTNSGGDDSAGVPRERIIIKEKECPACPACKCPQCPDCKCPDCPKCDCGAIDMELESAKSKVSYLKWMVRFLGSLVRRENAVNRALMEQCPGLYGVVPFVQQVDSEVNFVKNHVKKDRGAWEYFQQYFTRYSGIPSSNYEETL